MDIMNIVYAVLLMGCMGLIFGLLLTFVSKKFAVEADPKIAKIRECLSGANCGACGFPGCDACADAIASGKAAPSACPVAGADGEAKIAAIMGVEAPAAEAAPAAPAAAPTPAGASKPHRVAVIDEELCVGCTMCKRNCKFNAITGEVKQKHKIDAELCKGCGLCAGKCPKKAIVIKNPDGSIWTPPTPAAPAAEKPADAPKPAAKPHRVAEIDEELCVGCTMCKRNCKFDAITGEVKQKHKIDAELCKGCGLCAGKCPKKAIVVKNPDGSIWTPPAPKPAN